MSRKQCSILVMVALLVGIATGMLASRWLFYKSTEPTQFNVIGPTEELRLVEKHAFDTGIISNKYIKILSYEIKPKSRLTSDIESSKEFKEATTKETRLEAIKKWLDSKPHSYLSILYQAKISLSPMSVRIICDCYDKNSNPIPGTYVLVPTDEESLSKEEVRRVVVKIPDEANLVRLRLSES